MHSPTSHRRQSPTRLITGAALITSALVLATAALPAGAAVQPSDSGVTIKVTNDTTGTGEPNNRSARARISQSGDFVVYESVASNISIPRGGGMHVYFTDLSSDHHIVPTPANHTVEVDVSPITGQRCRDADGSNGQSTINEVSNESGGDGPWVVFVSRCVDLVPGWTHSGDVYIRNMRTGVIDVVSRSNTNNNQPIAPLSTRPVISDNGRYVAWNSGPGAVFVRDMSDPSVNRTVTIVAAGTGTDEESLRPEISGDGTHLVFASDFQLAAADTNSWRDIYRVDLRGWQANKANKTFTYEPMSVSNTGVIGNSNSSRPGINRTGTIVSYESGANNLVAGDSNANRDAFWRNTVTKQTVLVSVDSSGGPSNSGSSRPQLDDSGYVVAFVSNARDIVVGDDNTRTDAFVRTLNRTTPTTGVTRMLSQTPTGDAGGDPAICPFEDPVAAPGDRLALAPRPGKDDIATRPYLNGDATRIVFVSGMCNLVSPLTPTNFNQIYVRQFPPGGPQ